MIMVLVARRLARAHADYVAALDAAPGRWHWACCPKPIREYAAAYVEDVAAPEG